jgi:hypothetical protein
MRTLLAVLAFLAGFLPSIAAAQAPPPVPALPDTERRTTYSLTAQTGPFSVGFALYGDGTDFGNWVQVYLISGVAPNITVTQIQPVSGFTMSSATGPIATIPRPITDATITLTTAQTGTLQIVGARRPRRISQFTENRGVAARDLNQAVTDIIAENRERWDQLNRAIVAPPGESLAALPPAGNRAGAFLCWDATGLIPQACGTGSGLGNVTGPGSAVVGHVAVFANTAGTLLSDGGSAGTGSVNGPGSSTVGHVATWNNVGGTLLQDPGLTITAGTGTLTIANAKTLTANNSLTFAGTDGTTQTFQASDTVVGRATTDTLTNKTYNTAGTGNVFQISGTQLSALGGLFTITGGNLTFANATANTTFGNWTGSAATPSFNAMPTCSATGNFLTYLSGTGVQCNTTFHASGSWTPTITGSSTSGTGQTYTLQIGSYEVIGRTVIVRFNIVATSLGTAAGNVLISNLPFTNNATTNDNGTCNFSTYTVTGLAASNVGLGGVILGAVTNVTVTQFGNTGSSALTIAQAGGTPSFNGHCIYHT